MTNNFEIERKWLIKIIPPDILSIMESAKKNEIEQAYISYNPHIRIRRDGNKFILNFKKVLENNDIVREEFETEISENEYNNLLKKTEGIIISKTRYFLPFNKNLTIELDKFHKDYEGLIYAEIEFSSKEDAINFIPPNWFFIELTGKKEYTNAGLSLKKRDINEMFNC